MTDKPKRKYTRKNKDTEPYLNSSSNNGVSFKGEDFNISDFQEIVSNLKPENGNHITSVLNSEKLLEILRKPTLIVLKKNKIAQNTYESIVSAYWTRNAKCIGSFDFKGFSWGYRTQETMNFVNFLSNAGVKIKPEKIYSLNNVDLPFVLEP